MRTSVDPAEFTQLGVPEAQAQRLAEFVTQHLKRYLKTNADAQGQERLWQQIQTRCLLPPYPPVDFGVHGFLYEVAYEERPAEAGPGPAWIPTDDQIRQTNIGRWMEDRGDRDYRAFFEWASREREAFWAGLIERTGIVFRTKPKRTLDPESDVKRPRWLPGARLDVVDSCFKSRRDKAAILFRREGDAKTTVYTYGELEALVNRVANGLDALALPPDARIVLYMPMTPESVAVYLGVIRSGRAVVGVADTSAPPDLAQKVEISRSTLIVTVDGYRRGGKTIPIYPKVVEAKAPRAVVIPNLGTSFTLRPGDVSWERFLPPKDSYHSSGADAERLTNILFSSGTTKTPKAIPWSQTTPLKCVADGYLHHNVQSDDVLAWPTTFGWMMGPWLAYASLVNHGAMALFDGDARSREFCEFVQDAGVTMLGTVPKLVKEWREQRRAEGLDWTKIRRFSSTGETSNPDDMLWLMYAAGYRPVIEYCGGTEIGGGYITSTMVQPNAPSTFSTPALGLDLVVLDASGRPTTRGEVGIVPPSIGLSVELLNYDHDEEYFRGFFPGPGGEALRRHGDQLLVLGGGYFRHLGRMKDMINVNGVKTSSEELRAVLQSGLVQDTKPVGIDLDRSGQHTLVVYAIPKDPSQVSSAKLRETLRQDFNKAIKERLNPLLAHIRDVVLVDQLPQAGPNKTLTSDWFLKDYEARLSKAKA